jgi:predicted metal-dependent phosphoesterase TrpH
VRKRREPLLVELHSHTTWSDGRLTVRELVDVVGSRGFDVLCVTDHVVRGDDPWLDETQRREQGVGRAQYAAYAAELEREAERARSLYDLLVIPGLELTYNDRDPAVAAHAVAVGLHDFVPVDDGLDGAIETAAEAGAAIVAAHPYDGERAPCASRLTQRWSRDAGVRRLAHRFELFNRLQLFGWVAEAGLPAVACGDVHVAEHVGGWKTLLPCAKDEASVVGYLRSPRPVYLVRLEPRREALAA